MKAAKLISHSGIHSDTSPSFSTYNEASKVVRRSKTWLTYQSSETISKDIENEEIFPGVEVTNSHF